MRQNKCSGRSDIFWVTIFSLVAITIFLSPWVVGIFPPFPLGVYEGAYAAEPVNPLPSIPIPSSPFPAPSISENPEVWPVFAEKFDVRFPKLKIRYHSMQVPRGRIYLAVTGWWDNALIIRGHIFKSSERPVGPPSEFNLGREFIVEEAIWNLKKTNGTWTSFDKVNRIIASEGLDNGKKAFFFRIVIDNDTAAFRSFELN